MAPVNQPLCLTLAGTRFNESPYLRPLVLLHGGVTAVAARVGVARATLSQVAAGEPAVGGERAAALLAHLGVPGGRPADGVVHLWRERADLAAVRAVLPLFFPSGAEVQIAPWSRWSWSAAQLRRRLRMLPEVAVLRAGERAVLLRTPAGRCVEPHLLGPTVRWRGGGADAAELAIADDDAELWAAGAPGWWDLAAAWDRRETATADEAIAAWRAAGYTEAELVRLARTLGSARLSFPQLLAVLAGGSLDGAQAGAKSGAGKTIRTD